MKPLQKNDSARNHISFWLGFYPGDFFAQNLPKALFWWAAKKAYLDMNRTMTFPAKKDADAGPDIEIRRKNKQNEAINQMYKAVMNLKKDYLKIFVKVRFNHRMLHHAKKSTLSSELVNTL